MTTSNQGLGIELFNLCFSPLSNPRRTTKGNTIFSLEEILFLTISAVVSGRNTREMIEEFGKLKQDWFRRFYPFKRMLSHDTISKLFGILDAESFITCFINWVNETKGFH